MPKVTLSDAKAHLRVDDDAQDALITAWIAAAYLAIEGAIFRKVYDDAVPAEDETGIETNALINAAVLLVVGWLDVNRDAITPQMPTAATLLVTPYMNTAGGY